MPLPFVLSFKNSMISPKLHILLILSLSLHTLVFTQIATLNKDILFQSSTDLGTSIITMPEHTISIVQSVIIPDKTMQSGDQLIAPIGVKDDQRKTYKLKSGEIGGYRLTNLRRG